MILVLCIKQVDDGRIPDNLAAGKTSVHQGDASSTRELKVHPTHRGNYSLVPSVQIGVWRGPTTVRKTVGNSAANFRHIFTERELGDHDCEDRSEEHTSELQSLRHLVCRLL